MYTIYHSHYEGNQCKNRNFICMSVDSKGIDVQLVFKNNSADVAGSILYHVMSNFYDPTGG